MLGLHLMHLKPRVSLEALEVFIISTMFGFIQCETVCQKDIEDVVLLSFYEWHHIIVWDNMKLKTSILFLFQSNGACMTAFIQVFFFQQIDSQRCKVICIKTFLLNNSSLIILNLIQIRNIKGIISTILFVLYYFLIFS